MAYIIDQLCDGFQQGACTSQLEAFTEWPPEHSWTSDRPQKQASAKVGPSTIGSGVPTGM